MLLRRGFQALLILLALWLGVAVAAGLWLPRLLLHPPSPVRTPEEVKARLAEIAQGDPVTEHLVSTPEGTLLRLRWVHRLRPKGLLLFLHGFGDDALGTLGYARQLPEWDAAAFTFRGRDLDPGRPCTLGALERDEVVRVVAWLEGQGRCRSRLILVGVSQGAGIALLALSDLERTGMPLGGALLESPFEDLHAAARDHLSGLMGPLEPLARPAERVALLRAGRLAGFDPEAVSPRRAAGGLRTPMAFLGGDQDRVTPLGGLLKIAREAASDLTIVAGAGHGEAGVQVPGGWGAWARLHLRAWGLGEEPDEKSLRPQSFPGARGANLQ